MNSAGNAGIAGNEVGMATARRANGHVTASLNRSVVDNQHRFGQSPLPDARKLPFRSRRSRRSRSFPALSSGDGDCALSQWTRHRFVQPFGRGQSSIVLDSRR